MKIELLLKFFRIYRNFFSKCKKYLAHRKIFEQCFSITFSETINFRVIEKNVSDINIDIARNEEVPTVSSFLSIDRLEILTRFKFFLSKWRKLLIKFENITGIRNRVSREDK